MPLIERLPRLGFLLLCLFALVRTMRMGYADALARTNNPVSVARAFRLEPGNTLWFTHLATSRFEAGDASTAVEADLEHALAMRPYDAEVSMALGLIAEQRGDRKRAESLLLRACEVDRRFKPAWTMANFYFRTSQLQKMWPYIQYCLSLIQPKNMEPDSFDPSPVFALAWEASTDPRSILDLIPKRRETLLPYLSFLEARHNRAALEASMPAWPAIVHVAQPADRKLLLDFLDTVLKDWMGAGAVRVWNDLVAGGFAVGLPLDPTAGHYLADPDLHHSHFDRGFGWRVPYNSGVVTAILSQSVGMDFTGGESEHLQLLSTYAAVLPGRNTISTGNWRNVHPSDFGRK